MKKIIMKNKIKKKKIIMMNRQKLKKNELDIIKEEWNYFFLNIFLNKILILNFLFYFILIQFKYLIKIYFFKKIT